MTEKVQLKSTFMQNIIKIKKLPVIGEIET